MERELDDIDERHLVENARRQPEALRELSRHYFPRIFAYVASHLARSPDTEDLVSAIFFHVIEEIGQFEYPGRGAFAAWVFRIAHNAEERRKACSVLCRRRARW